MARETRQHGILTVERAASGRWAWINDAAGNCVCEIDFGCDLTDSPEAMHAIIRTTYEWAVRENEEAAEAEAEDDRRDSSDVIGEWAYQYYLGLV